MFKTLLVYTVICLVACQALADSDMRSEGTVTLASTSGLHVRVASASAGSYLLGGNVCGSAINTGGIARATVAVKTAGRVFLASEQKINGGGVKVATVTTHRPQVQPARKFPEGLGALLARIVDLLS